MDALQSTLAHAVNDIANSLGKRVAALATQVDEVQEASSRQRQREPDLEALAARLALLDERMGDTSAQQGVTDQISQLQRELSRIAGRLDSFARQAVAADERAEALRRDVGVLGDEVATAGAWRSELRDLTTRTTELAARVAETETVARRAGNAVIEALRQARADADLGSD
jgi:chromosome segregation ATPase